MKTQLNAKITIKGESKAFNLTVDWDNLGQEDMRALAQRSIVIAWQNKHRTANEGEGEWPSADPEIKAVDYKLGQRTQLVRDPVKMIEAGEFNAEQLEALLKAIEAKQRKGSDAPVQG